MTSVLSARGPVVRALRTVNALTLTELALAADVSPGYLSRIEREERTATPHTTERIAHALGVAPKFLTGQLPPITPLRVAQRWSRDELAESLGLDAETMAHIEINVDDAEPELLELLALRLGVSVAALRRPDPEAP